MFLPPNLSKVLSAAVKTANHVRGNDTYSRMFKVLCEEVGAALVNFCFVQTFTSHFVETS